MNLLSVRKVHQLSTSRKGWSCVSINSVETSSASRNQEVTMNVALTTITIAAGMLAAQIYGIFAGQRDTFPVTQVVRAKCALERSCGLSRRLQRTYFADTQQLAVVACPSSNPLVILTGGQSNAANALSDPVDERRDLAAFMFFKSRCYRLRDPLLGPIGGHGSLWATSKRANQQTQLSSLIVPSHQPPIVNSSIQRSATSTGSRGMSKMLSRADSGRI
jgi:hypothetical protein